MTLSASPIALLSSVAVINPSFTQTEMIALLDNSQQVRSHFTISLLFTYQGDLGGFMRNSIDCWVTFYKYW
ncbi:hypothetical protein [Microcoleus asticus]|uniref:hypothetical protein n=1 Tax=Microcoleus asticus TaxID=2815231 RepID=UPI001C13035F|nr:hypothetical protein [Microcoleus asticus]